MPSRPSAAAEQPMARRRSAAFRKRIQRCEQTQRTDPRRKSCERSTTSVTYLGKTAEGFEPWLNHLTAIIDADALDLGGNMQQIIGALPGAAGELSPTHFR